MEQSDEAKASTEERNLPTAYDTTKYKEGGSHVNNWPATEHCSDAESRAAEQQKKSKRRENWEAKSAGSRSSRASLHSD